MIVTDEMREDERCRLLDLIQRVVTLADKNPFCPIGHVVEHVIPGLREALTDALPPPVSREELEAMES